MFESTKTIINLLDANSNNDTWFWISFASHVMIFSSLSVCFATTTNDNRKQYLYTQILKWT